MRIKKVEAWAFLADDNNGKGKYFITYDDFTDKIYFKKPKPRPNPFDYSSERKATWKPTKIIITIK